MKIDIAKLSEDREIEFLEAWDARKYDLDVPGLIYETPLKIRVLVKKESGLAIAKIAVSAKTRWTCSRCFKEFETSFDKTFRLVYSLDLVQKVISLDDDIREELILNYLPKILCQPDCRGLCPRCGADLNESVCKCKRNEL